MTSQRKILLVNVRYKQAPNIALNIVTRTENAPSCHENISENPNDLQSRTYARTRPNTRPPAGVLSLSPIQTYHDSAEKADSFQKYR